MFHLIFSVGILSDEMSGILESVCDVQVSHALLQRINYENQSVVQNVFDINLFSLLRVSRIR